MSITYSLNSKNLNKLSKECINQSLPLDVTVVKGMFPLPNIKPLIEIRRPLKMYFINMSFSGKATVLILSFVENYRVLNLLLSGFDFHK